MTELAVDLRGTEESIQVLETVFVDLNTTLKTVASTMEKVVDAMSPDANAFSGVLEGVDAFNILADGRSNLEDLCEALNKGARAAEKAGEGFSVFKALIPGTEGSATTMGEKTKELAGVFPTSAAAGVGSVDATVTAAMNAVIGLPDRGGAEDLEGKVFGSRLAAVAFPRIPLLAKGAVLPANRPFLAMVGDQRQEAPLATIQEAVALVMGDQVAAMMAGFREVVREQQALRAAVEGIEVGDEVIGRAAVRYGERMAVVKGS